MCSARRPSRGKFAAHGESGRYRDVVLWVNGDSSWRCFSCVDDIAGVSCVRVSSSACGVALLCPSSAASACMPLGCASPCDLDFFSFRFFFFSTLPSSRPSSSLESAACASSRLCFFALFSGSLSRLRFFSFFSLGAIVGDTGVGGASIDMLSFNSPRR